MSWVELSFNLNLEQVQIYCIGIDRYLGIGGRSLECLRLIDVNRFELILFTTLQVFSPSNLFVFKINIWTPLYFMTWYPLMQAVISAGADHLTCSKLLKLDDMRMLNKCDAPGCNLLPSDRRQRHWQGLEGGFCWLGWFQLYQSPLQTRRTGPGANSQNILGNDFKMTGKNFFTMQCQLTITKPKNTTSSTFG